MAAPPWLAGLSGEKRRHRSSCIIILASFAAVVFLCYSLAYIFFGHLDPEDASNAASDAHQAPAVHDGGSAHDHDHAPEVVDVGADVPPVPEAPKEPDMILPVRQPDSSNPLHWDYDVYNQDEKFGRRPQQTFHSSDIKTPLFQVNTFKPRATEGHPYFFATPAVKDQKAGVQIFSRKDLSLVYAQTGFDSTNNFRMQEYNGKQYLTFWQGEPAPGHGLGQGVLYDEHYELAYNISISGFNSRADSHEFQLTHDGGAMFSVYETVRDYNMTPVGGPPDGVLQDSCFEEVDIATGETRFKWRASDWFSIVDTAVGYNDVEDYGHPTHGDGWDFFHINSLEKTKDGNYLVVGRRLKLVTLINGTTGEPIWQIGGTRNEYEDLSDGWATNFGYQHHARFDNEDQTEIVMFDNAQLAPTQPVPGCKDECSRALHIRMNHENKTAEVVRSYWHPYSVQARAEGSAERQANGNMLVGWGKVPGFTEYSRDGEVLLDVQTGPWSGATEGNAHVYRIYSMDWKAYPPWDPSIAMFENNAYVSWNGATELAYWAMFSGESDSTLEPQYIVYRGGFETKMSIPNAHPFARVAALDVHGKLLGSTDLLDTTSGNTTKIEGPLSINFALDEHTLMR